MGFLTYSVPGMSAKDQDAKRQYYAQFGLRYSGFVGRTGQSTQVVQGFYRGVALQAVGERLVVHEVTTRTGPDNLPSTSITHRTFLRVTVPVPPVKSLVVFPRAEYATGANPFRTGKYYDGTDPRYSDRLQVAAAPETGVPEFDAGFAAATDDESLDGTVLTPELASWIAADRRSYAPRIVFHEQQAELCFQGREPAEEREMFLPEWIFPATDHLLDVLTAAEVRPLPEFAPPAPEPEKGPVEPFDPVLTEAEVANRTRYFAGHGMRYSAAQHDKGESRQKLTGPHRGFALIAFGERLLVDHGESAVYRNFLQVHIQIGRTEDLIVFNAADHRTGIPPWTDNKYRFGLDLHAEKMVAVMPRQTGVPEFDSRFRVLASVKYAQKLMRPELAAWIAQDPRSPEGRLLFHTGTVSWCQMSDTGSEDLFLPDRIFAAGDYLLDLLAHVPPDLMRPVPYHG